MPGPPWTRLRVVHLPGQAGPGPARMRGLAKATGAYVWFADPDDLLAGGSLAAVADRLERDRPDVLLLDYRILRPGGSSGPSPGPGSWPGRRACSRWPPALPCWSGR
jgi:glycosyltransferase involved in cell wall biosynthesis